MSDTLYTNISLRLEQLVQQGILPDALRHVRHGIEKEGLRVTPGGRLSQRSHPACLGAKLTHPHITTDYSESLLEFITPVFDHIDDLLVFLRNLHIYTAHCIDEELMWASSMPMPLSGHQEIPIADYGDSNIGRAKYIYRCGLAHRYGKAMQTIAGVHYNVSLPTSFWNHCAPYCNDRDPVSAGYFGVMRNMMRYAWLLMYLFGASPVIDKSLLKETSTSLVFESLSEDTLYLPWATSLRMSPIGYTSEMHQSLNINYNTLDDYMNSLEHAIMTPYAPYGAVGLKEACGDYRQLNTHLLQTEGEYYGAIRPKSTINAWAERPLHGLKLRGVEYIELRFLDVNPLCIEGIDDMTCRFIDLFFIFCALLESPSIHRQEKRLMAANFLKTVCEGRKPGLCLSILEKGKEVSMPLNEIGQQILNDMRPIALLFDRVHQTDQYTSSLANQIAKLENAQKTPSALILDKVVNHGHSFFQTVLEISKKYKQDLLKHSISLEHQKVFENIASQSHRDQKDIEKNDQISLDEFVKRYSYYA